MYFVIILNTLVLLIVLITKGMTFSFGASSDLYPDFKDG